jgi:hypothetical protein
MKSPLGTQTAALLLVGFAFNAVWGWARGWPLSPAEAALSVVLFAVSGLVFIGLFRNVRLVRVARSDEDAGVARVYVNEVEVGSLPAVHYARVVREAWSCKGLYVMQALNIAAVVLRAALAVVRFIPWVWFLALACAAVFAPEALRETFARMSTATPTQLVDAVRQALDGAAVLSVVVCGTTVVLGVERFGYVNQFDEVISQRIRRILEVPAEGSMRVSVVQFVRSNVQ